jgi:hypothetical protein
MKSASSINIYISYILQPIYGGNSANRKSLLPHAFFLHPQSLQLIYIWDDYTFETTIA